ncbi:AraC family transcriptional regulator [Rhizobium fabae]|uniref:AraC family transcriptional regulator n=1 Tax=Rhizobium fabae TaxID=573179 RepID=A0ABY0B6P6_9HYPH|nr:AraC family transcriptional regulator [Rhizobium fabae]RUM11262.1 AraC family transcriptional regulator [Rhizobium fabae]
MNLRHTAYQPGAVSIASLRLGAGSFLLPEMDRHRILVHASAATRSYCGQVGKYFVRRAGDIDLLAAGESGGFEAESAFDTIVVSFPETFVQDVTGGLGARGSRRIQTRHLLRDERIEHLTRAIQADYEVGSPSGSLYADSIGIAITARLLGLDDAAPVREIRLSDAQLKRVLDFIEAHIETSLALETLSRVAAVSNSHLRTWFKAATGLTVHRYVLRRRIERARELLVSTDLAISEIAHRTGFAHQSHLARWMRREIGQTPFELRRNSAI